jgi:hypothetical protein
VFAGDPAGNTELSPTERVWTVDTRSGTELTINAPGKVDAGTRVRITGKLKSSDDACTLAQDVTLRKGSSVIGTTSTSDTGGYAFRFRVMRRTVVHVEYEGNDSCLGSTSEKATIRLS